LDNSIAVLGGSVTGFADPAAAVAASGLVVVTTPDPVFAALDPACFTAGGRRLVVLDCWRVLPAAIGEVADVVYPGRGPGA
jgi:hypothetical protein